MPRWPNDLGIEAISDHQPLVLRQNVIGEVGRNGECKKIAIVQIVTPFVIGLEIGKPGLDLDDGEPALVVQRHDICASPIGERQLEEDRLIGSHQRASHSAFKPCGHLRADRQISIDISCLHRSILSLKIIKEIERELEDIGLYRFLTLPGHSRPLTKLTVQRGSVHKMSGDLQNAGSSENDKTGSSAELSLDATAIELATGLTITDVEVLGSFPPAEVRAEIAVKFAREFDRIAVSSINKLSGDLLGFFSKDQDLLVRKRFSESIKTSPFLPSRVARRLAEDEIEVAAPILRESPVLDDALIGDIAMSMPEPYVLTIAERRPLSEGVVDLLIAHKGTRRVVARLLDNDEADISESALLRFRDWGQTDLDIADRFRRRPNLPFAFVNQSVIELADSVQWPSLSKRTMTKSEATLLQDHFEGRAGHRLSPKSARFVRLHQALKEEFERGLLTSSNLLAFLRDRDIERLECGFAIMAGLDLRQVRQLLQGSDQRGLIALCLRADFSTADYLAFRMALSLAALGTAREQPQQQYSEKTMMFARDQFERMRAEPYELQRWLPSDAA